MPLQVGARVGACEVTGAIGAGGMGEVYRARDTKLGRDVAIKILPEAFAHDADRLARFQREARTLASLNHPHIAGIYGLEESAGVSALVMELVEGEDLSQRLARGPIPLDEALPIARQIASALEAAHESGVVHRDLKPANVKLRDDGTVKVLDFGLAKAMQGDSSSAGELSNSPTLTSHGTQFGVILGTAAYMAPEQAKGRPVDRRADVWAFGVVLYEMLTGKQLFEAGDVSEVLAAVLTRQPDWAALPANTPAAVRRLLMRCLTKDRAARLDSAAVARFELEEAIATPASDAAAPAAPKPMRSRSLVMPALFVLAGLAGGAAIARWAWPAETPTQTRGAAVVSSITATPEAVSAFNFGFALSPDATTLVYSARQADGKRMLWKRRLDTPRAEVMAGTEGAIYPFWSPDSRHVGFFAGNVLKRVAITGGPTQVVTDGAIGNYPRGSWNGRDEILFSLGRPDSGVQMVPAGGGRPQKLAISGQLDNPQWLPDDSHFLFTRFVPGSGGTRGSLIAASVGTPDAETKVLGFDDTGDPEARLSADGFLVLGRAGVLNTQAFNFKTLQAEGPAVPIADHTGTPRGWLAASVAGHTVVALNPSVAETGGTPGDPVSRLVWVDRSGHVTGQLGPVARYWTLQLSPDSQRAIVNKDEYTWSIERTTNVLTRVGKGVAGLWMPDSRQILFGRSKGFFVQAATGEGQQRQIGEFGGLSIQGASAVSPDGRLIAATATTDAHQFTLGLFTIGDNSYRLLVTNDFEILHATFSGNGRWIAYAANQTGRYEVFARPIDNSRPAVQISVGGGQQPFWRRADDNEIYFLSPTDEIVAVDTASLQQTGVVGARTALFRMVTNDIIPELSPAYAVTADGRTFLINTPAAPEPLTLIQLPKR